MTLAEIERAAATDGLAVVGAFHPESGDNVPGKIETLCLLGADGPAMWDAFSISPEYMDGHTDPLDRWSERVIGALADSIGGIALFPFGGPPWQPFQQWAGKAEGAAPSPVLMQVTRRRGLWASYRGAIGIRKRLRVETPSDESPCLDCHAPCLVACPVEALGAGGYDVPACIAHLKSDQGASCLDGCLVRKACPYGHTLALPASQRSFHIEAFIRSNG